VARSSKKKPWEITPSRWRRLPISLALAWGGMTTVTLPCGEVPRGWKSSTRNQMSAPARMTAIDAPRRPRHE
jgi:hypothetical protein